jgi:hypothetical protein
MDRTRKLGFDVRMKRRLIALRNAVVQCDLIRETADPRPSRLP